MKCNHVAARTMEQFRRLGVAQKLRDAGLPADYPNDVVFRTSVTGIELTRIPIPCRRDRYTETEGPDAWWPTPEPPHRINQIFLEPILLRARRGAAGRHAAQPHAGHRLHAGRRRRDRERHRPRHAARRAASAAASWSGCDGGSSGVRKQIGAKLEGTAVIQRVQSTYIRAPQLRAHDPRQAGLVVLRDEPAPLRHHVRHRRARDLAGAQPPERRGARVRFGRPRPVDPRDPRRRRRLRVRGDQQGRLGRPPPGGQPLSRPAACSSRATRRTCGCRTRATA